MSKAFEDWYKDVYWDFDSTKVKIIDGRYNHADVEFAHNAYCAALRRAAEICRKESDDYEALFMPEHEHAASGCEEAILKELES